jgi:hypothetical protein
MARLKPSQAAQKQCGANQNRATREGLVAVVAMTLLGRTLVMDQCVNSELKQKGNANQRFQHRAVTLPKGVVDGIDPDAEAEKTFSNAVLERGDNHKNVRHKYEKRSAENINALHQVAISTQSIEEDISQG